MMTIFIGLLICCLSIGIILCLSRLITGPTLAERTVAGDGVLAMIMGIFILVSILRDTDLYLNAVLVIALLGFISTLTVARFIEIGEDND